MTAREPPPPTIAEFAPQSVENITDAPDDQSSSAGTGAGECQAGQACGVGSSGPGVVETTPAPIQVARVRRCVGDPPRQIEDPQSPPCVPYWDGDNGGATAMGVTRDQIRLIGDFPANMITFFNQRFEFYGRKLVVQPRPAAPPPGNACTAQAQAEADGDASLEPFATSIYFGGCMSTYMDQLARHGVINVAA